MITAAVVVGFALSPALKADAECSTPAQPSSAPVRDHWTNEQVANARVIVTIGQQRRVPDAGLVVAVATAMQESSLRNLRGGDRDSIGLFQQRPSQGWGTPKQLRDPAYQTGKFYDKLLRTDGWQQMRVTEAAQAVQISAYPEAYAKHVPAANRLVERLSGGAGSDPRPSPCS
ncbi:peptidase M23 [Paractinoplanes pyxinae]|uniref:peptidase M23 n=1 Tax=Paractinoplanes pyxinae TaxID=2997416 RepID=UPI002D1E45FD|nr:peptidase M23 [Actinoplanes pyxinae]